MKSYNTPIPRIVVLAAGFSSRLGEPKPLARIRGLTLLDRMGRLLLPFAGRQPLIVIVPPRMAGYGALRYRGARHQSGSSQPRMCFIVNPHRAAGLSSSVRMGVAYARNAAAVLLVPVDLAELTRSDTAKLIRRWSANRRQLVARRIGTAPGTPLILPRRFYSLAMAMAGDRGLQELVRRLPPADVTLVAMPSAAHDIDTPRDLERARRRLRPP